MSKEACSKQCNVRAIRWSGKVNNFNPTIGFRVKSLSIIDVTTRCLYTHTHIYIYLGMKLENKQNESFKIYNIEFLKKSTIKSSIIVYFKIADLLRLSLVSYVQHFLCD